MPVAKVIGLICEGATMEEAVSKSAAQAAKTPESATARERMDRKLRTKRGRALYKKRSVLVGSVFGMIKSARGRERFARRGLAACAHEWKLICTTHNLLKLWRHGPLAGGATTG